MNEVTLSWEIAHPPAKVWRAMTETNLLAEWIMPNDLKLEVGHKFTFKQEPTPWWDGVVDCEVLEVQPNRRLVYSWQAQRGQNGKYILDTVVAWTLQATDQGTKLSLVQSGFNPDNGQAFAGARVGWDRNVENLIKLLVK